MINIELPRFAAQAISILKSRGHRAYAVGGCVRDSLRGVSPSDWDICTSAKPDAIAEAFSEFTVLETGIAHGTLTVLFGKTPVEITTFRVDGEYKDNRHPESVTFTDSLELDLSRRDFTVNAMAYAPGEGVIDPFGGKEDLKAGIIRCVGNPEQRFNEDALRILRALRFASVLSFDIAKETGDAILKNADLLSHIAAERIRVELTKLICGESARSVLSDFRSVIAVIIPELEATFDFSQKTKYHIYDVWQHTLHALEAIPDNPVLRLTMLLHDSGKPFSFTQDADGTGHFYGHPEVSRRIADEVMHRLRYDKKTIQEVCTLVKYHDADIFLKEKSIIKWLNKIGEKSFLQLLEVKRADNAAQNPEFSWLDELAQIEALYREMKKKPLCYSIKHLAVDGRDLMDIGITDGCEIGKTLDRLLSSVMSGQVPNDKETLLKFAEKNI